jgi:hypothetical protein
VGDTLNLEKPKFVELPHGKCAGAPILKSLWDRFDLSLLLSQAGIYKERGVPTWMLAFLYVVGLIAKCSSVNKIAQLVADDQLLQHMFRSLQIAQHTLSRFLTGNFNWELFGLKRVARLQQDPDACLKDGDSINLDDTLIPHPFNKSIPFLSWLFDHSKKVHLWAMNVVALQAVLQNGLEYPLSFAIWQKPAKKGEGHSKIDLAQQMLLKIRDYTTSRLWVAMDRWYLCKDFFNFLTAHSFDWVTKAKRNTALFRRMTGTGRERFVPMNPIMLIMEVFGQLMKQVPSGIAAISIPDIYIKMPYQTLGKRGKMVRKFRYVVIAAVVVMKLPEDREQSETDEQTATYHGAYLIISNRHDQPEEAVNVYVRRWRIEVFFRNAKQELMLTTCHSPSKVHHHAHLELVFTAETLLNFALWELNNKNAGPEKRFTHGEMVESLFHTRCQINMKNRKGFQSIYVYFDTKAHEFARLFDLFWPKILTVGFVGT